MRGSRLTMVTRPVSVMPQASISGTPKRFSNASCSSGSTPAPMPNFTVCWRSSGTTGWFSSIGGITPR